MASDYDVYPSVDESNQFPPVIRQAMANSPELQSALNQKIVNANIPGQVESGITSSPTVKAGVDTAIVNADIPGKVEDELDKSGAVMVKYGGVPPLSALHDVEAGFTLQNLNGALPDVLTWLATRADGGIPEYIAENLVGIVVMDSPVWSFAWYYPESGTVFAGIMHDGTRFNMGDSEGPTQVRVIPVGGQSNVVGKGGDEPTTLLDPPHPRVFMATNSGQIVPAAEPIISVDDQASKGFVLEFGRLMAEKYPNDDILLVSGGLGGTGFFSPAGTPAQLWDPTATDNLYTRWLGKIGLSLVAASARWKTIIIDGIVWHQGEADRAHTESEYAGKLDLLIDGVRTYLGDSTIPFILGQCAPEYIDTWTEKGVNLAHINTPLRKTRTAFAPTEYGWVNSGGIHFTRLGYDRIAQSFFDAYPRAVMNVSGALAEQPLSLEARRVGADVLVKWEPPGNRVESYLVDWNPAGNAVDATAGWVTTGVTTKTTLAREALIAAPSGSVITVRVRSVNATGTSISRLYTV